MLQSESLVLFTRKLFFISPQKLSWMHKSGRWQTATSTKAMLTTWGFSPCKNWSFCCLCQSVQDLVSALWFQSQERLLAEQTCGTSNTGWDLCSIQLPSCPLKLDKVLCEDQRKSQQGLAALCCLAGLHRKAMLMGSSSFKMPTCQYCLKVRKEQRCSESKKSFPYSGVWNSTVISLRNANM